MKKLLATVALALLFAPAPAARAADVSFPDTPPGRHARDYFAAFRAGEEAMRDFMNTHADAEALRQRPVDVRLEVYRRMKEEHGDLVPVRIDSAGEDAIAVVVRNGQGELLSFAFSCATAPPHGLSGLRIEALGPDDEEGGPVAPLTGPPPTDEQIVAAFAAELDSLAKAGSFSGTVLLDKGGRTLFSGAYGMASREEKRPNSLETRFNLGSINKKFTSVAIHQLAEAGKLGLDDPIALHLKDFPAENAGRITVRMLLDHRSGIRDVLRTPGLWEHPERVRTTADWYRMIKDQPLNFEPGSRNEYSNGGYAVLGMIVERVSGQDYYAYIREHVYRPAGMARSESFAAAEIPADAAVGYTREPEGLRRTGPGQSPPKDGPLRPILWRFGRPSAAGGGYSTVGDLVKFRHALAAGKLLGAEGTRAEMAGGLGIAGGSPGCNALLEASGPYTLAVLSNFDPPAAERFVRTVGRMIQRAANAGGGPVERVTVGGPGR